MKKHLVLITIVGLLVLMTATAVGAKVAREPFTSEGTLVGVIDPGEWTYPDGNMHVRGMVESVRIEASDPRLTGDQTIVANGNWDADGYGPLWTTWRVDVDAFDGYWEGTSTGKIDENGLSARIQGRGYGDLAGLLIEGTYLNGITEGVIKELPRR
jgi:hypothetical protein